MLQYITFWVPRELVDMFAFTTNVEFDYWIHTGKVLYGRPDGMKKIKYFDWLYKTDLNKEPCTTIEDLLKYSMELANKIDINKKNRLLPIEERIITKEDDK